MSTQRHLQSLLSSDASGRTIRSYVDRQPESIFDGYYPILHQLVQERDVHSARALLAACPEALDATCEEDQMHAIHLLLTLPPCLWSDDDYGYEDSDYESENEEEEVEDTTHFDFITLFLETNPEIFCQRDAYGNNAFHYILDEIGPFGTHNTSFVPTVEGVQRYINLNPSALKLANNYGDLPLHKAASVRGTMLGTIFDGYPDAVKVPNAKGEYLLHIVSGRRFFPDPDFKPVLDQYPEAASKMDNKGWLPLHRAITCNHINEDKALLLVEAYPEALRVPHPCSGSLLMELAEKHGSNPDLMARMEEALASLPEKEK